MGSVNIANWGMGSTQMLTPWQQSVWDNTKEAATVQAGDNEKYRAWYKEVRNSEITWWTAAQVAVKTAIDIAIADKMDARYREIAKDQRDLANRQLQMGEELHARYINKFAIVEDAMADFAKVDWETNRYKPQYAMQQGRAKLDADRAFGKVAARLNKKMSRYCTGANANMLMQVEIERAKSEVGAVNHAYRKEEALAWERDDLQWKRLVNIAQIGQKLPTVAAESTAAGIKAAENANTFRQAGINGFWGSVSQGVNNVSRFVSSEIGAAQRSMYAGLPGLNSGSLGGAGLTDSMAFNRGPDQSPAEDARLFRMAGGDGSQSSDVGTGAQSFPVN